MIGPEAGRAAFTIGVFVLVTSGALLLVTERSSAEFYVSLLTFLIGVVFTGGIIALVKWGARKG